MRLTPPKKIVFWISLALTVIGIIAFFVDIPFISGIAFWFPVAGALLLAAGNYFKGF